MTSAEHPPADGRWETVELPASPDVVVIGGGTAGCASARLLASWGHLVVLLERDGVRPPLAESIPPSALPLLEATGIREAVEGAGFLRCGGNTVWWGGEPMRVEPFPGGRLGFQVLRSRLEEVLRSRAADAGVVRVQPATATRVERRGTLTAVEVALSDGARTLHAPWVLDCSGRAGVAARAHRLAAPDGIRTVALIDVWERLGGWSLPDDTHTLVESARWGWGWSVPVTRERRLVTMMVDPGETLLAGEEGVRARYAELLATLPALRTLGDGAVPGGTPWAYEATPYSSREVAFPGLLLVGDAASAIDPLSSFGVKKALASAWLAAIVVHTALVTPEHGGLALQLFREREAAYVRSAGEGLSELSRAADAGRAIPFWSARADAEPHETSHVVGGGGVAGDRLIEQLRVDPDVRRAFERLRTAPVARISRSGEAAWVHLPVVRGNVVVPEQHLRIPGVHGALRYLRSVDLVALLDLAERHDDVGAMYAEYVRRMGPVHLPDFLGALSLLLGKGVARLA